MVSSCGGEMALDQPVNQCSELEVQIGQALCIVRGELNLQVGVAGGDVRVMVELFCQLGYLQQARHEVAKAVKCPGFFHAALSLIPAPGSESAEALFDVSVCEGSA